MAKNAVDTALAHIDAQIADLERARGLIVQASNVVDEPDAPKKPRKPRKKRGMPEADPTL